jgi:hypothetical protein
MPMHRPRRSMAIERTHSACALESTGRPVALRGACRPPHPEQVRGRRKISPRRIRLVRPRPWVPRAFRHPQFPTLPKRPRTRRLAPTPGAVVRPCGAQRIATRSLLARRLCRETPRLRPAASRSLLYQSATWLPTLGAMRCHRFELPISARDFSAEKSAEAVPEAPLPTWCLMRATTS